MKHLIKPFANQTINPAIDRNDPKAAATAIELEFPKFVHCRYSQNYIY